MVLYTRTHAAQAKIPTWLGLGVVALIGVYGVTTSVSHATQPVISPLAESATPSSSKNFFSFFEKKKNPEDLGKKLQQTPAGKWVNYSILVIDYTSPFELSINDRVIYAAASVNKIPILAVLYAKASKGEIDLDKSITIQQADIQDYGTGVIRYDPPGTTYTVKTLARLMMQKSDNTAAYVLGNYVVGIPEIQSFVNQLGLTQTDIANNKTSNRDIATMMKKIFNGEIANLALTQEMKSLFTDSDFEDRLPGKLPDSAKVYHKIGTGVGAVHDVGIIEDGKVKYYVGIFTSDIRDEEQAAEQLAEVSKVVYDFMKQ